MVLTSKKTEQIGLRVDKETLEWIDRMANECGSDRSKIINLAISRLREERERSLNAQVILEDGYFYKAKSNNGKIVLERVNRETVEF